MPTRWRISAFCCWLLFILPIWSSGCSRYEYAQEADEEAHQLVVEKSNDPRWGQPGFNIALNPGSRYYDIYDTVEPPMPPDDPVSHQFMRRVDGMKGWKHWHDNGDRFELENPAWEDYLRATSELSADGKVLIDLADAVQLAYVNSPDYQEQLETLYLSALDVSTERFRFDVQFFGSFTDTFQHLGSERPGGESNTITKDSSLTARRRFATAGELLVGFANTTVWEFFGPNASFTTSILNFSFVQPLLRAGGREFALEQLTIVERALLANLRALARYHKGFYTEIAIGDLGVQGPRRRGGFFGGTGLTGFTGQGSGGFGGVGAATGFGGSFNGGGTGGAGTSGSGFAGGGAGTLGGFIGLLQQLQQIRNSEQSLDAQLRTLDLLEANLEAGLIDIAQVDQFRQSIETERATLLQARVNYETALESFLSGRLGLPPDLPVELNDEMIKPFRFIPDATLELQQEVNEIQDSFADLNDKPTRENLQKLLTRMTAVSETASERLTVVKDDLKELKSISASRADALTESERKLFEADVRRMEVTQGKLEETLEGIQEKLTKLESRFRPAVDPNPDAKADSEPDLDATRDTDDEKDIGKVTDALVTLVSDLQNVVGELSLIQGRARLEVIDVPTVSLSPERAIEIARAYRLDWMNNRAALVDTWRLIEFNANALKSDLTLSLDGDIRTLGGDNPLKFRDETGSLRASIQFDPPFTRLLERNNFRSQLITYQQSRRNLIQFEDGVYRTLRTLLRRLDQLKVNLEIQRRAVAIAIRRVDQTRETLNRPVPPPQPGQPPAQFGPTAAINLLTALSDLRNTQNNFLSVYLNYDATRMVLMRELGIMQVDERGLWIDEPLELALATAASYSCDPLPPELPAGLLESVSDEPENAPAPTEAAPAPAELPAIPPTPPRRLESVPIPGLPSPANPMPAKPLPVPVLPAVPAVQRTRPSNRVSGTDFVIKPAGWSREKN